MGGAAFPPDETMVPHSFFQTLTKTHEELADLVMITKVEMESDEVSRLAGRIDVSMRRHFEVEDRELYPVLLEAVDDWEDRAILMGAHEGHRIMMQVLGELEATPSSDESFRGKVHLLDRLWTHHIAEEEEELYDMARKYLEPDEFSALSKRIKDAADDYGVRGNPPLGSDGNGHRADRRSRQTRG